MIKIDHVQIISSLMKVYLRLLIAKIVFMGHSMVVFQNTNVIIEFSIYAVKLYNVLYFMRQKICLKAIVNTLIHKLNQNDR